ncbi:MAG: cbb3-type cytochrome oxidase assembly protein CcoS [Phycisphaerales bacterium]
MSVIFIMIPAALLLAAIGVAAFVIAAKQGQFDDLDTPALRAVFDDDDTLPPPQHAQPTPTNPETEKDEQ